MIFLFNIGGYYILFLGLQHEARTTMLARIEKADYRTADEFTLTIPLALPYPPANHSYERAHGEFEYQGEYYKLIRQKLENDTLFLMCVKDSHATKIAATLADYSRLANDLPAGSKRALNLFGKLFKDFQITDGTDVGLSQVQSSQDNFPDVDPTVLDNALTIDSPPPDAMLL